MKAEELMIGDWVYIHMNHNSDKYKEGNYIPNKVVGDLHPYRVTEEETISMVGIENNAHDDEFCIPIPLTKEILEKNFEKIGDADYKISGLWRIWKNPNYGFIIATLAIDDFGGGSYEPCIPCKYVHKLQHFLSLIDLEKEIIL